MLLISVSLAHSSYVHPPLPTCFAGVASRSSTVSSVCPVRRVHSCCCNCCCRRLSGAAVEEAAAWEAIRASAHATVLVSSREAPTVIGCMPPTANCCVPMVAMLVASTSASVGLQVAKLGGRLRGGELEMPLAAAHTGNSAANSVQVWACMEGSLGQKATPAGKTADTSQHVEMGRAINTPSACAIMHTSLLPLLSPLDAASIWGSMLLLLQGSAKSQG